MAAEGIARLGLIRSSQGPWVLLLLTVLVMPPFMPGAWIAPLVLTVIALAIALASRLLPGDEAEALGLIVAAVVAAAVPLVWIGAIAAAGAAGADSADADSVPDLPSFLDPAAFPVWIGILAVIGLTWSAMARLSSMPSFSVLRRFLVPALFGALLLWLWEVITKGCDVPRVLLPAPSDVWAALGSHVGVLAEDFVQTVILGALRGYIIGSAAGFGLALLADRVPFLERGLLPLGNLASAVPLVGVAPIMVMWFGFGWESKAAVVVISTFFPMLVNTLAGLAEVDRIQLDLMRSYGAGYGKTMTALRLPAALPFIFNGLKINSTLALIGAIVAEFFGSPIVGMGFRISTEVARMNVDVVWATIAVAAVAGSGAYGLLTLAERRVTFWHASLRSPS